MQEQLAALIQEYLTYDYAKLFGIAQDAYDKVLPFFAKKMDNVDDAATNVIIGAMMYGVNADGVINEQERKFVCDVFNISSDKFDDCLAKWNENSDLRDFVFNILLSIRDAGALDNVLKLFLCCVAIDGVVNAAERKLLSRLFRNI